MKFLCKLFARLMALNQWFEVKTDAECVYLDAEPAGREPWSQQFRWDETKRSVAELSHEI